MKLIRKTVYEIEHIIPGIGELEGIIELSGDKILNREGIDVILVGDSFNKLVSVVHEIDYNKIPESYKGRLKVKFYFPIEVVDRKMMVGNSEAYNTCIESVYEALKKIIEQETEAEEGFFIFR